MLIRRKLPPLIAAIGLLSVVALGAAVGRRSGFIFANLSAGAPALSAEPITAIWIGVETVVLAFACLCAIGLLRFHRASRRMLNVLLFCAIMLCVYKGMKAFERQDLAILAPYGTALAGAFVVLFSFNRSEIAEMYAPSWPGHDIPEHPTPAWLLAGVTAAGIALGVWLQRMQDDLLRWLKLS